MHDHPEPEAQRRLRLAPRSLPQAVAATVLSILVFLLGAALAFHAVSTAPPALTAAGCALAAAGALLGGWLVTGLFAGRRAWTNGDRGAEREAATRSFVATLMQDLQREADRDSGLDLALSRLRDFTGAETAQIWSLAKPADGGRLVRSTPGKEDAARLESIERAVGACAAAHDIIRFPPSGLAMPVRGGDGCVHVVVLTLGRQSPDVERIEAALAYAAALICAFIRNCALAGEMQAHDRRWRTTIESLEGGVWDIEGDKRVWVSDRWRTIFGLDAGSAPVTRATMLDRIHPDDRADARQLIAEFWNGERDSIVSEMRMRHASGRWLWVRSQGRRVPGEEDGAPRFIVVDTDITSIKRIEAYGRIARDLCGGILNETAPEAALDDFVRQVVDAFDLMIGLVCTKQIDGSVNIIAETGTSRGFTANLVNRWDKGEKSRGPIGVALREKRTVVMSMRDPALDAWQQTLRPVRAAAFAAVPIVVKDEVTATLALFAKTDAAFTPDLLSALEDLGRLLSLVFITAQAKLNSTALEHAANAIVVTDAHARIEGANRAFERLWGWSLSEILGRSLNFLKSGAHPPGFYASLWSQLRQGRPVQHEFINRRRDGRLLNVFQTITPVRNATGQISHYIGIQEDISARKDAEARVAHLVSHDVLTGLANRATFLKILTEEIEVNRHDGPSFALLVLDIDRFKLINESLGHDTGDQLLLLVSEAVTAAAGPHATVARLGDDEFAVLARDTRDDTGASAVARRLSTQVARVNELDGRILHTTISIGITMCPHDGDKAEQLVRNADLAMYRAKADGRNTWRFFAASMDADAQARLRLEQRLRLALAKGELQLHYQPQVRLKDGKLVGFEALARWTDEELGAIPPSQFIPVAEECGLIDELGTWAFETACRQVVAWESEGRPPVRLSVNLSFGQFTQASLLDQMSRTLANTGADARALEIELTESMLAQDHDRARALVQAMSEMGLHIAIDDFGTGYSSLSRLIAFPVNRIKIDGSFIRQLGREGRQIVKAIIAMSEGLGISTIAECVETREHAEFLIEAGCDEAQGWFFGFPVPAGDIDWSNAEPPPA